MKRGRLLVWASLGALASAGAAAPAGAQTPGAESAVQGLATGTSEWTLIAPALLALGGVLVGVLASHLNSRRSIEAAARQGAQAAHLKANEAEAAAILSRLDRFYGPYLQLSGENALLARELKARQPAQGSFRTLLALLDPDWLPAQSQADRTLIAEIVANGAALRKLIRDASGLAEPALLEHLARAGVHFTVLALAHAGALANDPDRFRLFVYPDQLDEALRAEVTRLTERLTALRTSPTAALAPMTPLALSPALALPPWPDPRDTVG